MRGRESKRWAKIYIANSDTRTGTLDKVVAENEGTAMSFRTQTLLGAAGNAITITAGNRNGLSYKWNFFKGI